MKYITILVIGLALGSCTKGTQTAKTSQKDATAETYQTTPNGLQYRIFPAKENTAQAGRKAAEGEIIGVHMSYDNGADSVLFSSFAGPSVLLFPVMPPTFKGGLEEGFSLLSPGDSGVFKVNADSLFANTFRQPLPPFVKPGTYMNFSIKMMQIMSQEEAMAEQQRIAQQQKDAMEAHAEKQAMIDETLLQDYIKANNINAQRTPNGLYYTVTKKGTGPNAKAGQTVKVHYTGTTLDGNKFDSSVDRGQPFEFMLGQGQVIKGWDEGIALLNKGAKATLLIPSGMAYGERSPTSAIPPNGILKFDVELIDMK